MAIGGMELLLRMIDDHGHYREIKEGETRAP